MATDPPNGSTYQNLQVILASVSPILAQLPKWIELGAYLEFGDNEVRLCEFCHDVCEWVYFKLLQFNSDGLELCGSCLEKCKDKLPWKLYIREGLVFFLGSLNALVSQSVSENLLEELDTKTVDAVEVPTSAPSKSVLPGFEPGSSGQLIESWKLDANSPSEPLHLPLSSEPTVVSESTLQLGASELVLASNSDQVVLMSSSDSVLSESKIHPAPLTKNSEQVYLTSEPFLLSPNRESPDFSSNSDPMLFTEPDPNLLTSNSEPVLFTSNAEPVHFLSLSKPVLSTRNADPDSSSSCQEAGDYAESLPFIPKSEPLRFTSTSAPTILASDFGSFPITLMTPNHVPLLSTSDSKPSPVTPSHDLSSDSNAAGAGFIPNSEKMVRTQSKGSKKVSDGTLVDRMRVIVQRDCRLGKDLFTTGIELADRYNSYYKHETIHVRRVFEAMKTLGYAASKDTMQVQVQQVKRKVKLIYGVAIK